MAARAEATKPPPKSGFKSAGDAVRSPSVASASSGSSRFGLRAGEIGDVAGFVAARGGGSAVGHRPAAAKASGRLALRFSTSGVARFWFSFGGGNDVGHLPAAATASGDSGFARGLFSSSSGSVSQDSSDAVVMSSVAQPASECTGDAARGRSGAGAGGGGGGGGGGAAGASSRDGLRMRPIKFMALPIRPLRSAVRGVSAAAGAVSSSFDVDVSPMSPKLARFGGILGFGLLVVGGGGGGGGGGAEGAAAASALGDAAAGAAAGADEGAGAGGSRGAGAGGGTAPLSSTAGRWACKRAKVKVSGRGCRSICFEISSKMRMWFGRSKSSPMATSSSCGCRIFEAGDASLIVSTMIILRFVRWSVASTSDRPNVAPPNVTS